MHCSGHCTYPSTIIAWCQCTQGTILVGVIMMVLRAFFLPRKNAIYWPQYESSTGVGRGSNTHAQSSMHQIKKAAVPIRA